MNIPSYERLQQDLGSTYVLGVGQWVTPVPAQLIALRRGTPMNAQYEAYEAELLLPPGVDLPQVSCAVGAGQTVWPLLLLSPKQPGPDGRHRMQMTFQTQRFTGASGP